MQIPATALGEQQNTFVPCSWHHLLSVILSVFPSPALSLSLPISPTLSPYLPDDNVSSGSTMDVDDRLSHLEQRVQLQEDEIQLLKAALADALRRLGSCEELTQPGAGAGGRRPTLAAPTKGEELGGWDHVRPP